MLTASGRSTSARKLRRAPQCRGRNRAAGAPAAWRGAGGRGPAAGPPGPGAGAGLGAAPAVGRRQRRGRRRGLAAGRARPGAARVAARLGRARRRAARARRGGVRRAGRSSAPARASSAPLLRPRLGLSSLAGAGLLLAPGESKPPRRLPGRGSSWHRMDIPLLAAAPASRTPVRNAAAVLQHLRVLFALVVREMGAKFGRSWGGYLWAILEPLGGIVLLSIVFSLALRTPPLGTSFTLFYASGIIPFFLFSNVSRSVAAAISHEPRAAALPGGHAARRGVRQVPHRLPDHVGGGGAALHRDHPHLRPAGRSTSARSSSASCSRGCSGSGSAR